MTEKLNKMLLDMMNSDSIYYKLLVELYDKNDYLPKTKQVGRELHHKIPKFYFKMNNLNIDNSNFNLVSLTKADHFLAHYYLWRGANEKYYKKCAAPMNFMLRFVTKGLSSSNITDEDTFYIEKLMKAGSGNLTIKGTHWYNNGEICVMAETCPEGFVEGRINFKKYAEIRLQRRKESHKEYIKKMTDRVKKCAERKAKEYFKKILKSDNAVDLAINMWNTSNKTQTFIADMLLQMVDNYKKYGEDYLVSLKYWATHIDEYDVLYKSHAYKQAGESCSKTCTKKLQNKIEDFLTAFPNHSKYWYNAYTDIGGSIRAYFHVSLQESLDLISMAYHECNEDNLGYFDFKRYYRLNKLDIIEKLEKTGKLSIYTKEEKK